MKRILIILIILSGFSPLFAQTLTFDGVKRSLEKSDADIQHEKRKINANTWLDRGVAFMNAAEVNTQFLRLGMPKEELILFMKSPLATEQVESKDGPRELYKYSRINVYLQDGAIVDWKETEFVHPDPLTEALSALKKATQLDEKKRYEKQIQENLNRLNNLLLNKAILAYQEEDYNESFRLFSKSIELIEMPVMSHLPADTAIYFNTGLVASFAKNHQEALKFYQKAKEMDYGGGNLYVLIKDQYIAINDSASAEKILQDGFAKYPNDNAIVIELTNYYITAGKSKDALEYLRIAKELEPTNASLYFAEGFLFEKLEEFDKAIDSYQTAIDVNPEYFDALYNIGAAYYNKAVREFEKANEIMENKAYIVARDAATATLAKALPYMEKAHEVNPNEKLVLETLKTLYYRLQMPEKLKMIDEKLEKFQE